MTITTKIEGEKLTVALEGNLDTVTSPDLEKALNGLLPSVAHLVLDLAKLEYISSAGLRVILSTSKVMARQGTMNLVNVPENIKEIFDMTGFSEVLNIE